MSVYFDANMHPFVRCVFCVSKSNVFLFDTVAIQQQQQQQQKKRVVRQCVDVHHHSEVTNTPQHQAKVIMVIIMAIINNKNTFIMKQQFTDMNTNGHLVLIQGGH